MRLAIVAQEYPPETAKGGIGAQALIKAHGLAARGHDVHVISRSIDGQRSERMDGRVHLIRIPGFEKRMPVYTEVADWLTYSAEVSVALHELHNRLPLDLVEFPEWAAEGYVYFANQSVWNRIPTVIQIHGPLVMFSHAMHWPEPDSDFYKVGSEMEGFCLRKADAIYSSSAYSASWCEKYYCVDASAIPVIHTGVDTELFSPKPGIKSIHPTIAFTGKLVRNKGAVLLVEAACQLRSEIPGLRVMLMGRGEEKIVQEMKHIAQTVGCPDLLDFKGFVSHEELPNLLSQCHVFAMPATHEGGPGLVCLEAMACGLPVIACEGNGVSEIVEHGSNGLLITPDNATALTDALKAILLDAYVQKRMSEAARHYAVTKANSRDCLQRIEQFFTSVVASFKEKTA